MSDGHSIIQGEISQGTFSCRVCHFDLLISEFDIDLKMKLGHRNECRKCHNRLKLENYHRRKTEISAERKAKYQANPQPVRQSALASYHRNSGKWAKNRQDYRRKNRAKCRAWCSFRRAKVAGSSGSHTADDVRKIFNRQRGLCFWCGIALIHSYEVDHVIPISRGGANYPENLVVSCERCNGSKHDKLPVEWKRANRTSSDRFDIS